MINDRLLASVHCSQTFVSSYIPRKMLLRLKTTTTMTTVILLLLLLPGKESNNKTHAVCPDLMRTILKSLG